MSRRNTDSPNSSEHLLAKQIFMERYKEATNRVADILNHHPFGKVPTGNEFELRTRCPRPTKSEHGAIFRLRAQQAEAMDGRRAQRRQDADLMPWMACIPLMQEQLTVCAVLMGFRKIVSSAACRRPKERGQFL